MIIYSGNKIDFMESVTNDTITINIERNILEKMHRKTGEAELRSWTNSLKYMHIVLNSNTIPEDAGIAIEYNIPPTGKLGDDFAMSWNLDGGRTYATDPNSINEVGCIHTTQGLEFDYVGVIIGEDMRYGGGHIVTDFTRRAKTDQSLKGIKSLYKEDPAKAEAIADEIIKNTYRTLMTRGMKGCYVYCCDERLAEYLKKRLRDI